VMHSGRSSSPAAARFDMPRYDPPNPPDPPTAQQILLQDFFGLQVAMYSSILTLATSFLTFSGVQSVPTKQWLNEHRSLSEAASTSGNDTVGAQILAKAMNEAGLPYAWGGGSCDGPTGDQPPYDYGDTGFDCSGLVCYALCQVTGRDLFSEGLRVTSTMYCASESELKYTKYPYAERVPGDAVFFGGACDCSDGGESIHHVGLMMDSGDRLWNAPSDESNEVKESSIADFSDDPCPYVVRFT